MLSGYSAVNSRSQAIPFLEFKLTDSNHDQLCVGLCVGDLFPGVSAPLKNGFDSPVEVAKQFSK